MNNDLLAPAVVATMAPDADGLKAALIGIVGAAHVRDDAATRELYSQDIWSTSPETVVLVVSPASIEEVASVMAAAQAAGCAVAPRGAGMSYTGGYLSKVPNTVSLDLARMDRILNISAADMTVTVECGCSWAKLHDALKPLGLRTPFWGAMSGLVSTIGGGLSQLNAMFGAGHYGTTSESVIALSVVLANGRILRTGARGKDGNAPFYRHYGPDLAGLFCGDSGVFGIKAHITLRLIRTPAHEAYASFSFKTGRDLMEAMAEITRCGIASEMCAFDPGLTRVRMQRASLGSDLKTLGAVITKQKSLIKGLVAAGKIALAGRDFVAEDEYPLHVIAEGRTAAGVADDIAQARRIASANHGHEIENTIAKVIRAQPFPPLNSVLGPRGERWIPIHGIVPLSQSATVFEAIQAVFHDMAPELERAGVATAYLFTGLSTNALIIEPVFYWPEARTAIHSLTIEPDHLAKLQPFPSNPKATDVVIEVRKRVIAVYAQFGCGHFQVGRAYPYRASRDAASWDMIEAVKQMVDPTGIINPGALGMDIMLDAEAAIKPDAKVISMLEKKA
jgi:FAD/FMN-containing dehydrogenase